MYSGYKIVPCDDPNLSFLYTNKNFNWFDTLENEYIAIQDADGEVTDEYKWTQGHYARITYGSIDNEFSGKIRPRNYQQRLAFDLLQDGKTTIKILTGCFGSGKTMLMVTTALDLISKGKFDKIVWVRNNIEVKDSVPLGALPGGAYEKLLPFAGPLIDHVGGLTGLEGLLENGTIELQHLGFMRGRDIKNSIIICSEAENLTIPHVQLLIGRVADSSQLWLDGDYKQVDKQIFKECSGLQKAVEKLAGEPLFGYVNLPVTERSETARLADKLD